MLQTTEPAVTSSLTFNVGDMLAYGSEGETVTEQIRVRYLLRVTVGATFGKYVNSAVAMTHLKGKHRACLLHARMLLARL
ncbi:hypothetical protein [Vibrio mexicanus]|uniref:hypothetical protein n=1 Tax=Vibrio mexicanus TaxID=1004326 RepID=UPI00307C38CA